METNGNASNQSDNRVIAAVESVPAGVYVLTFILLLQSLFSTIFPLLSGADFSTLELVIGVLPLVIILALLSLHPIGWFVSLLYFFGVLASGLIISLHIGAVPTIFTIVYLGLVIYLLAIDEYYDDPVDWLRQIVK